MRFRFRPAAAFVILYAAAAAACTDTATGPETDLAVTTSGPVQFHVGELTSVTVTVTNNSRSRTYQIVASGCEDPFTVSTVSGSTFPVRYYACALNALAPRALRPGQSTYVTRDWSGEVGSGNGIDGTLLSPGTYVVRGFVRVADGSAGTTVASNAPLTTQILAR